MRSPPKSPDLNPIEMIQADLKDFLRAKIPNCKLELARYIYVYNQNLTPEKYEKYINNLIKVNNY